MGVYKEVARLSPVDAAYIAGLIDGEGTITLSRRHAKDRRQLVVSIANTEIAILEFVLHCSHAGKITRKRVSAAHHTPSFAFCTSNRQALELLRQVAPYLRSHKRERAQLVLDEYLKAVPRNGKYSPQLEAMRLSFENRFFAMTARSGGDHSRVNIEHAAASAAQTPVSICTSRPRIRRA